MGQLPDGIFSAGSHQNGTVGHRNTVFSDGQPTQFRGFTGDWVNTLRSLNVNQLRVLKFMNQDFPHNGSPKIDRITPAFTADKLDEGVARSMHNRVLRGWQSLFRWSP